MVFSWSQSTTSPLDGIKPNTPVLFLRESASHDAARRYTDVLVETGPEKTRSRDVQTFLNALHRLLKSASQCDPEAQPKISPRVSPRGRLASSVCRGLQSDAVLSSRLFSTEENIAAFPFLSRFFVLFFKFL